MSEMYEQLVANFEQAAYSIDRSRGFELAGIKAAFVVERLTEVFGLIGTGWRFAHSPFEIFDKEIVVEIVLQYRLSEEPEGIHAYTWSNAENVFVPTPNSDPVWSEPVYGTGGNRVGVGGVPMSDARKSAISGAISKAASRLGVGLNAYKGLLIVDGATVTVREDAEARPGDAVTALNTNLGFMLKSHPDVYGNLLATNHAVKQYHKSLIAGFVTRINDAGLTEFIRENLQKLVDRKALANLTPRELLFLSGMIKSIGAEETTWQHALEIAGEWDKELSWDEFRATHTPDAKDDG